MSSQLLTILLSAVVGLIVGVALRYLRPDLTKQYAGWSSSLSWKAHACFAVMFALSAVGQVRLEQYVFATMFAALMCLSIVVAYRTKLYSPSAAKPTA